MSQLRIFSKVSFLIITIILLLWDRDNQLLAALPLNAFIQEDIEETPQMAAMKISRDNLLLDNNKAFKADDFFNSPMNGNPEESGNYFEGDILITGNDKNIRNGIMTAESRWPNAIVPYKIEGNFTDHDLLMIEEAINAYQRYTCVQFKARTIEEDYLAFVNDYTGCFSTVGRLGGRQIINLQSLTCFTLLGTVIHEMMHTVGFYHEQNREDRDDYVKIQYENVAPEAIINFKKAENTFPFGTEYDYGSVMHYSAAAFSKNGLPTIVPLRPLGNNVQMGQRLGFSATDIIKLNRMYKCSDDHGMGLNMINIYEIVDSFVTGFLTGLGLN